MQRIAEALHDVPLILMCGRNLPLAKRLRAMPAMAPRVVLEFTPDVPHWMRLADFFIGKPGPGSLSEAVHMGLPVLVMHNGRTLPQERWNVEWVRSHDLGVVYDSYSNLRTAADEIHHRLSELQGHVRSMRNRAVFEVPHILQTLLDSPGSSTSVCTYQGGLPDGAVIH
jgi:1,2-diacylglycerol 3-beta-galactosyltransferase